MNVGLVKSILSGVQAGFSWAMGDGQAFAQGWAGAMRAGRHSAGKRHRRDAIEERIRRIESEIQTNEVIIGVARRRLDEIASE